MSKSEKEKAILDYMKKLDISREEAEQLFEDDENDFIGEEGEQMTEQAKKVGRHYEQKGERKKSTRERKVDEDKQIIMQNIENSLLEIVQNLQIKTENECSFSYNGCEYSLKIIKHRPKKQCKIYKSELPSAAARFSLCKITKNENQNLYNFTY